MTATKALAGSVGANVVVLVSWYLSTVSWIGAMPDEPKAALLALVVSGLGGAVVYFAPANRATSQLSSEDVNQAVADALRAALAADQSSARIVT